MRANQQDGESQPAPDPRLSMAMFGWDLPSPLYRAVQAILTWVTGKALPSQKPLIDMHPLVHAAAAVAVLLGSAALTMTSVVIGGWWWVAVPFGIAATVVASRTLWLTDLHAASHGSFSPRAWLNELVGDLVSLLMLVLPGASYSDSHVAKHHGPSFCSPDEDPDGAFLIWLGLRPGTPKRELWRRLLLGLVSPRTHMVYLWARLRANLVSSGFDRAVSTMLYLLLLAAVGRLVGWMPLLVGWIFPLVVLYQIASIVGWAGEHLWFEPPSGDKKSWHTTRTHARYFGEPYPVDGSGWRRMVWAVRMLGHAANRFLFVPGDLPNHDWHHRHAKSSEWTRAAYARQAAIDAGDKFPFETWGLKAAIDRVLSSIADLPPLPPLSPPTGLAAAMTILPAM